MPEDSRSLFLFVVSIVPKELSALNDRPRLFRVDRGYSWVCVVVVMEEDSKCSFGTRARCFEMCDGWFTP